MCDVESKDVNLRDEVVGFVPARLRIAKTEAEQTDIPLRTSKGGRTRQTTENLHGRSYKHTIENLREVVQDRTEQNRT